MGDERTTIEFWWDGGMVVSVILVLMMGWMLFRSTTFNKFRVLIKLIYRKK